jgi:hypothetical protein
MTRYDNDDKRWPSATVAPSRNPLSGAPIVYSYSRQQAIADGFLIDVSELARRAGFIWPVAITAGLHDAIVPSEQEQRAGTTLITRLWDVLTMLWIAIRRGRSTEQQVEFRFILVSRHGRSRRVAAWAKATAEGHNGAPVITIMLQGED